MGKVGFMQLICKYDRIRQGLFYTGAVDNSVENVNNTLDINRYSRLWKPCSVNRRRKFRTFRGKMVDFPMALCYHEACEEVHLCC